MKSKTLASIVLLSALSGPLTAADWKPAAGPLMTRWAKEVRPETVHNEYPRPQLVRTDWMNLNGLWQLEIAGGEPGSPPFGKTLPGSILVPFPVESALSGVMKHGEHLWYRRTFQVPANWFGRRLLLHFGAVDWEAEVFLNGKALGTHRGGFDGFSFDVTDSVKPAEGVQELIVRVFDPTDKGPQPRGKQVDRPGGIFYTPTSGIWQTVWMEPVSPSYLKGVKVTADPTTGTASIVPDVAGDADGLSLRARVLDGTRVVASATIGGDLRQTLPILLNPADVKPWTPEAPYLYGLEFELRRNGVAIDTVASYFGMRTISVGPDEKGVTRILLNGKPVFQVGPLDQGFWPDGLYTAPTDEALKYDVEVTKQLGFNMTRKHVKVEPDRWYYWCDKLGLLVWQDMPSGDKSIGPNDPDIVRTPESARIYETELKAMIDGRFNHPSIVTWVIFNEGWGQFDTAKYADWTKKYDPSRLCDSASGWTDRGVGDLHDLHSYPAPSSPKPEPNRAAVLGEFGGLGLKVDGHTWEDKIWGYAGTSSQAELTRKYERLMGGAWDLKDSEGLSGAIYTQITDVETEANGLLTYDRAVIKVDPSRTAAINKGDRSRVPVVVEVVKTSRVDPANWKFTFDSPTEGWQKADFDDSSWKEGPGGFGTKMTPGASVRTEWSTPDIWVRRDFQLPDGVQPANLVLQVHHDEDAEVYLNGVLACKLSGYVGAYGEEPISEAARLALKPRENVIAIHCHQTGGGQYIDAGLVEVKERKP